MAHVAIIPARSGSKRVMGKNTRLFHGKPLIAWSIETALQSGLFDQVIVSTDDAQIADIAQTHGGTVPALRPNELSDDHTPIKHVVRWSVKNWCAHAHSACLIYATAPLLSADYLKQAYSKISSGTWDYALSITSFPSPIQRALSLAPEGGLALMYPEHLNTRSQDLQTTYHDAGQFCWGTSKAWTGDAPVFGPKTAPIIIPRHLTQDIDTEEDWEMAEGLFALEQQKNDS